MSKLYTGYVVNDECGNGYQLDWRGVLCDMPDWTPDLEAAAWARCEAATKGPWAWEAEDESSLMLGKADKVGGIDLRHHVLSAYRCKSCQKNNMDCLWPHKPDADFIAHARTDLPAAIREIRRLREVMAQEWDHTPRTCPCSWFGKGGVVRKPEPIEDCTCGLKEALYG